MVLRSQPPSSDQPVSTTLSGGSRDRNLDPLQLRNLGRALLHAAAVGLAAGVIGSCFFLLLEWVQREVLERFAGYTPLRAYGERAPSTEAAVPFRPWLLWFLPAIGATGAGLVTVLFRAPEVRGGGGDAMLDAFHNNGGIIRRRVVWAKMLASILTLGFGGSGGREGPTMQIGGALGSIAGRYLKVTARERRILLVAGVAAGMAAVFRTPLGAALLAVEILYRDDFESDALIPALLASVMAYSVFVMVNGQSTLFAHAPNYPFYPAHRKPLMGRLVAERMPMGRLCGRWLEARKKGRPNPARLRRYSVRC